MQVITDKKMIEEVLERGVELVFPDKDSLKKLLMSGRRIRLYCGFDPSAPALHIGNAILINKLGQFQDLGHEVIFLVGDFTGMIGDPTDKSATRPKLTRAEVTANSANYQKQASAYLDFGGDNPAVLRHNSEWSDSMTFKDLIELSSNFTVQQLIQRDMFQERIKNERPIYLHEFLYPLAQGYDSVAMDVDLEIGGNDQMFNMLCGRDLQKAINKKEKFVLTMKLLADDKGKKMGKSEGNAVFLSESADNIYGVIMSWPDGVIASGFELCTKIPYDEVKSIQQEIKAAKTNPRDLKMHLAYEITRQVHGEDGAKMAQEKFVATFQKKETPAEMPEVSLGADKINILDLLVGSGLAVSKGEARRVVVQKGVKVDGKVVDDINAEIGLDGKGKVVQKGKIHFVKIKK